MRVALLLEPGDPHGLTAVAARLPADVEATVLAPDEVDASTAPAPPFDLAVATGRRSAARLDALPAAARALVLMDMEDRALPVGSPDAEAAAALFTLPLPVIVPARWMADQLEQLRPADAPAVQTVAPGVDHAVFTPPPAPATSDGPLRVLVLGGDGAPAAAAAMREPATITQLDPATTAPAQRAAAYAAADVVLALPRIAGFPAAPLEAFHLGATCVMTAVTGHDEYVVDGANGLLTSWDDERGTSRLLDLLARDRALLHRLRAAALATARAWPDADAGAALLAAALRNAVPAEARA